MTIRLSDLKDFSINIWSKQGKISESGLTDAIAEFWDVGGQFSQNSRKDALIRMGFVRRNNNNSGVFDVCINGTRNKFNNKEEDKKIETLVK